MPDFFDPVRLDDASFRRLIDLVERAIARREATLMTDSRLPLAWIEVFDPDESFGEEAWQQLRGTVTFLDQLLLYAFDQAPDSLIAKWAADHDADLSERAVERVRMMREQMPTLSVLWDMREASVLPTLNRPEYEVAATSDNTMPHIDLLLAADSRSFAGRVDPGSTRRFVVRLLPTDVAFLHDFFGYLSELIDLETAAVEGPPETEGEETE